MVLNCLGVHIRRKLKCLKYFVIFLALLKHCDKICDGSPSQKVNCDGHPSQFSVTICDGLTPFRHNLWRKVTNLSQNCDGFRHNSHVRHKNNLPLWSSSFENCDEPSVTNWLWRKNSVTIFPSQKIVTDAFPSQLSVTNCDWSVTITFVMNEIVTDSFSSQFPSQIALFRHIFINFPSQFPSQIATFPVVNI